MNKYALRNVATIMLLMFGLIACNVSDANITPSVFGNFSLSAVWSVKTDQKVDALATDNEYIAIANLDELQVIRASDLSTIWTDEFLILDNSALKIFNGKVYAVNARELRAYDLRSGNIIWKTALNAQDGRPEIVSISADRVLLLRQGLWIVQAYEELSGAFLWEIPSSRGGVYLVSNPDKKLIYVLGNENITAYDIVSGVSTGKKDTNGFTGPGLYRSGVLYYYLSQNDFPDVNGSIVAFDILAQSEIWTTQSIPKATSISMLGNNIVIGTETGVLAINPSNGQIVWQNLSDNDVQSPPILLDGVIYVQAADSKNLYAFDEDAGDLMGYLGFDSQTSIRSHTDYMLGIHQVNNILVFTIGNTIYGYGKK